MKNTFNIGDRVVSVVDYPAGNISIHAGDTGTVCDIRQNVGWVGVRWDNPIEDGHSCDGACESDHGWRVSRDALDFEVEDVDPPFQFNEDEFNNLFR